jgi:poly-gamma-glutamate capsule biosynthesis protein CapA/YwtB (metallophosphatase superfamily)
MSDGKTNTDTKPDTITLFLCGDVMTGRGIDQILPHPSKPQLYEPYVRDARDYVALAEQTNGIIPRRVDYAYIWGDTLKELELRAPAARIINLETSVTSHDTPWPDKGINYRMHPKNIPCIDAAGIDCCGLANNHVLDWDYPGLDETLKTLKGIKIKTAGAGSDIDEAKAPAILELHGLGRLLVYSYATASSGASLVWAAAAERAGINYLYDLSEETVKQIADDIKAVKRQGDVVIASIHWGGNWGYEVPAEQVDFAHALLDKAGVDIIHGHSSHHPKGIEVYRDRPILYGCGDFLNDYEGISGYEHYRDDLTLMYFVTIYPATGKLARLEMVPMQIRKFRLNRTSEKDTRWLADVLSREGRQRFNTDIKITKQKTLQLVWNE